MEARVLSIHGISLLERKGSLYGDRGHGGGQISLASLYLHCRAPAKKCFRGRASVIKVNHGEHEVRASRERRSRYN